MNEKRADEMILGRVPGRCCVHGCTHATLPHWSVCLEHALRMMLVDVPAGYWQFGHVFPFRPDADGRAASVLFVPSSVRAETLTAAWSMIAADRSGSGQALSTFRESLGRMIETIEDPARQEAFARALAGRPEVDRAEDDGLHQWPSWSSVESWAANVLYGRGWLLYPPAEDAERNVGDAELHKRVAMLEGNVATLEAAHGQALERAESWEAEARKTYDEAQAVLRTSDEDKNTLRKERDEARANFKHAYDVAIRWEEEARRCWSVIQDGAGPMGKFDDFAAEMERRAEEIREQSAGLLLGANGLLEDVHAAIKHAIPLEQNGHARRCLMAMGKRLERVREEKLDCGGWAPDANGPRCKACETSEWACREDLRSNGAKCCDECSHDIEGPTPTQYFEKSQAVRGNPPGSFQAMAAAAVKDPRLMANMLSVVDDPGLMADPPVELGPAVEEDVDPGSDICGYCGAARIDHLGVVQRCPEVDQGGYSLIFDAHPEPFDAGAPSFVVGVEDPDDLSGDVCKRCSFLREDHDNTGKALVCPKVNEVVDAAADVGPLYPGQTISMFEGVEGRPELCVWCGSNVEAHVGGLCPVQHGQARTVPAPAPVEAEGAAEGAEVEDPHGSEKCMSEPRSLPFGEGFKNRLDLEQEKTEEKPRCEVGAKGPLTLEVWAEVAGGTLGHEKLVQYVVQWVKSYPCAASVPLRQVCEVYDAWRKSAPMSGSVNVCESLEGIRRAVSERRWLLNGSPEFHQAVIGGLVFERGASEHLATYKSNAWLERLQLVFVTRLVDALVASVEGDVRVLEVESFGLVRAGLVAALAGSCDHVRSVDPWAECIETSEAAAGYRGARDRAVKVALELVEGLVRS